VRIFDPVPQFSSTVEARKAERLALQVSGARDHVSDVVNDQIETLRALASSARELSVNGWPALVDVIVARDAWTQALQAFLAHLGTLVPGVPEHVPQAHPWEPCTGCVLPHNGRLVLAHRLAQPKLGAVGGWWVLCFVDQKTAEPFATWHVTADSGNVTHGHYFAALTDALTDWKARGF